jgi:hypothetical protein
VLGRRGEAVADPKSERVVASVPQPVEEVRGSGRRGSGRTRLAPLTEAGLSTSGISGNVQRCNVWRLAGSRPAPVNV